MSKSVMALTICALLLAFGCQKEATTSGTATTEPAVASANLTPEQLGELGAKIKKQPSDAQRLLSEQGLTEQSFETAIRKVSEDPEASKRYAEAYKRATT
jgi:hypothetical protein